MRWGGVQAEWKFYWDVSGRCNSGLLEWHKFAGKGRKKWKFSVGCGDGGRYLCGCSLVHYRFTSKPWAIQERKKLARPQQRVLTGMRSEWSYHRLRLSGEYSSIQLGLQEGQTLGLRTIPRVRVIFSEGEPNWARVTLTKNKKKSFRDLSFFYLVCFLSSVLGSLDQNV